MMQSFEKWHLKKKHNNYELVCVKIVFNINQYTVYEGVYGKYIFNSKFLTFIVLLSMII